MSRCGIILIILLVGLGTSGRAQMTFTGPDEADAFVATGSPANPEGADLTGLNFGGAGILVVAPAASAKGEFQSLLKFNLAAAAAWFNTAYGSNQWTVTALALTLTSNYGTAGGQPNNALFPTVSGGKFVIEWLSDNDWLEGAGMPNLPTTDGVTYDSLPSLLAGPDEILGTNTYTPPGNNVPVTYALPVTTNLMNEIGAGGEITLLFYAADNEIGYLFNSYNYGRGNEPLIQITAGPRATAPVIISAGFTNGQFQLAAIGAAGLACQVQASSDLNATNWQTLGAVTADGNGFMQFADPATGQSRRFYRLWQPAP